METKIFRCAACGKEYTNEEASKVAHSCCDGNLDEITGDESFELTEAEQKITQLEESYHGPEERRYGQLQG